MVDLNKVKALASQAAEIEDQTETTTFEASIPPVGPTVARFTTYVDLGKQPRTYNGKPKPPADSILLGFDLVAPKNIHEATAESPAWCDKITLKITKSTNEKAGFKKLFTKMTYGRADIKHMAQMLGEAFVLDVAHEVSKKDGKERTFVSIKDASKEWTIRSPFIIDPITGGRTDVPVPAAMSPLKVFIWDLADKETWDSLFIDGVWENKKPDGTVETRSKNWIQETLLNASDLPGSPLEAVVKGLVAELPLQENPATPAAPAPQTPAAAPQTAVVTPPATQAAQTDPSAAARAAMRAAGLSEEAIVAALGPVPGAAPVDPKVAALKAAGLTDDQIAAALAAQGVTPAVPTPAAPATPEAAPPKAKRQTKKEKEAAALAAAANTPSAGQNLPGASSTPLTTASPSEPAPAAATPSSAAAALAALGLA